MSAEDFLPQSFIAAIAELTVEPMYIAEIARKLSKVDDSFEGGATNRNISMVSRGVMALADEQPLDIQRPSYVEAGGNQIGSQRFQLTGEGIDATNEWRMYKVVHNTATPYDSVREEYQPVVNEDMTMERKLGIVRNIIKQGRKDSVWTEEILEDQIVSMLADWEEMGVSDYNDPSPDLYVQNYKKSFSLAEEVDKGAIIEISVRYTNPIGGPYVDAKRSAALDMEIDSGLPVDLVILAPEFREVTQTSLEDDDLIEIIQLPTTGEGSPILVPDSDERMTQQAGSDIVGPAYPVVMEDRQDLIEDLEYVEREINVMTESEYRTQLSTVLGQVL